MSWCLEKTTEILKYVFHSSLKNKCHWNVTSKQMIFYDFANHFTINTTDFVFIHLGFVFELFIVSSLFCNPNFMSFSSHLHNPHFMLSRFWIFSVSDSPIYISPISYRHWPCCFAGKRLSRSSAFLWSAKCGTLLLCPVCMWQSDDFIGNCSKNFNLIATLYNNNSSW